MKFYSFIASTDLGGLDLIVEFGAAGLFVAYWVAYAVWYWFPRSRYTYPLNWMTSFICTVYILITIFPNYPFLTSQINYFPTNKPHLAHSYPITADNKISDDLVEGDNVEFFKTNSTNIEKLIQAYRMREVDSKTPLLFSNSSISMATYGWHVRDILSNSDRLYLLKNRPHIYVVTEPKYNAMLVVFSDSGQCLFQDFYTN